jgi:hypothetical protein
MRPTLPCTPPTAGIEHLQKNTVVCYSDLNLRDEMVKSFWIFVHVDLEYSAQAALLLSDRQEQMIESQALHCPGISSGQTPLPGISSTA